MKLTQTAFATLGLVALASAADIRRWDNGTVWTTEVVTAYTTYCPAPTTISMNNQTYTITSATTLTITNCPCTVSSTVPPTSYTTPPSSPSASPVASSPTSKSPALATNAAVALGSSFGALVMGAGMAILL